MMKKKLPSIGADPTRSGLRRVCEPLHPADGLVGELERISTPDQEPEGALAFTPIPTGHPSILQQ
jgi:hypothetical protein